MGGVATYFQVLGLRASAGPLTLTRIDDDTLVALAELAAEGVHEPGTMPFPVPWTLRPPGEFQREFLRYHWRLRADFTPDAWSLELAVRHEGVLVGVQGVHTRDFLVTRTGETGSWLALSRHGRGIGTSMRRAMCALLFDHLGFTEITSAAFVDNPASGAVSRKVGYRENGVTRRRRGDGTCALSQGFVLTPDTLVRGPELRVEGAGPVRRLIGLDAE